MPKGGGARGKSGAKDGKGGRGAAQGSGRVPEMPPVVLELLTRRLSGGQWIHARELSEQLAAAQPNSAFRKRNKLLDGCRALPDIFQVDDANQVRLATPGAPAELPPPRPPAAAQEPPPPRPPAAVEPAAPGPAAAEEKTAVPSPGAAEEEMAAPSPAAAEEAVRLEVLGALAEMRAVRKASPLRHQLSNGESLQALERLCQLTPPVSNVAVDLCNMVLEQAELTSQWRPTDPAPLALLRGLQRSSWHKALPGSRRRAVSQAIGQLTRPPVEPPRQLVNVELSQEFRDGLRAGAADAVGRLDTGEGWLPQHERLINRMTAIVRRRLESPPGWPQARFAVYGSAKSGFGLAGSDLDVSLVASWLEPAEEHQREVEAVLRRLTNMFGGLGMYRKACILRAKVPIVKLEGTLDNQLFVAMDICVNNLLAVHNSELLRCAQPSGPIEASWQSIFIVRPSRASAGAHGQKLGQEARCAPGRRLPQAGSAGIADASKGYLSSYSYTLLTIFFLQAGGELGAT